MVVVRRRNLSRLLLFIAIAVLCRLLFFNSSSPFSPSISPRSFDTSRALEIEELGFFERVTHADRSLNVQKHKFLQARMGRDGDERDGEFLEETIREGVKHYWDNFQWP